MSLGLSLKNLAGHGWMHEVVKQLATCYMQIISEIGKLTYELLEQPMARSGVAFDWP